MATGNKKKLVWYKALGPEGLDEGRVTTVTAGVTSIALSRLGGKYGALNNHCPHQGGPLGEGSIEEGAEGKCWLRCPWHGWDFNPLTGESPGGHGDHIETYAVEERDDGIYVGVHEEPRHQRTIGDLLAESLVNWGVRHVFGIVGHSNLGMADGLRRQEDAGKMKFIGVRHEGAGAFACSAYAKLTGKPAACLAIAGPGATNLMTGMYDAKVDRVPMLVLAGQVDNQVLGPGAFQEVNLQGAFNDVSAFNHTVYADSKHGELVSLALKTAILTRNPVNLILPNAVQETLAQSDAKAGTPAGRVTPLEVAPPRDSLDQAVAKIKEAKRPIIVVGHGAKYHKDTIVSFAEKLHIPVLTTFKGKGLISDHHPLGCGVLGRSGTPIASWFMNECDRIIAIGASFSNHTGIASYLPTIQIDFDPMALGRFDPLDLLVYGEIGRTMEELHAAFPAEVARPGMEEQVAERWKIWRSRETATGKRRRGPGCEFGIGFCRDEPAGPGRRRDRRGRRQQHLQFRALFRGQRQAGRLDVRLPGLHRIRLSGRHGCLGRHGGQATGLGGYRRWRLRSIPGGATHRRQVWNEHHPRVCSTTVSWARSPRNSERANSKSGRPTS